MTQNKKKLPKAPKEPPASRTHDPTRDYEELVDQALRGGLGQPEKAP